MRKYHSELNESTPRPRRSRVPAAIAVGLALLVSPLVYEGGQVMIGHWASMMGGYRPPETPILNAIGDWTRSADVGVKRYYSRVFSTGSWSPSTAVPLAIVWALLMGVVFLRRVR